LLTLSELQEVKNYPECYYAGSSISEKIHPSRNAPNDGFDTADGRYKLVAHDHLAFRYELLAPLGRGSFGDVVKALDHKTGRLVAIKVTKNDEQAFAQGTLEVTLPVFFFFFSPRF
jgi:dual specificity tyrosine-phosphorylation-regulated kinase 2/3/4